MKIKILNLRNALWWTSKKFWYITVCLPQLPQPLTCFQTFSSNNLVVRCGRAQKLSQGLSTFFVFFSFDSTHISMNENGFCSCLTKSWIGLLFLYTLVYWAYLAKTWRHLLDTIYQEQIDSYLAHLPGSDITPGEMIEQENEKTIIILGLHPFKRMS